MTNTRSAPSSIRHGSPRSLAVLTAVLLSAVGPLLAAPSAGAAPVAPVPSIASAALVASADEPAPVTWSVRPADESGPDGRSWVERELDAGATVSEHLAVRNLGEQEVTFAIKGADGYFTPTGRFNMLSSDQESVAAGTWITVEPSVTVPAGETVVVPFAIAVPTSATPGDHAAGIAASIVAQGAADGTAVGVESRVGFRVMVRVAGELDPQLAVKASGHYVTSWNPFEPGDIDLEYAVINHGNVRLSASGSTEWSGERHPESDDETAVGLELLPDDERSVQIGIPSVWPLGIVSIPLTVEQSMVMPDGTTQTLEPIVQTVTVWAIPWPQLAILAALVLIVLGLFWRRRRRGEQMERAVAEAREQGRREAAENTRDLTA